MTDIIRPKTFTEGLLWMKGSYGYRAMWGKNLDERYHAYCDFSDYIRSNFIFDQRTTCIEIEFRFLRFARTKLSFIRALRWGMLLAYVDSLEEDEAFTPMSLKDSKD